MDLAAKLVEFAGNGQSNRTANTAADDAHLFHSVRLSRLAQRTDEVGDVVAFLLAVQLLCSCSNDLEDNIHRSGIPVISGDGERNTLSLLIHAKNNKLSRLCLAGNEGRLDGHMDYRRVQDSFLQNFIHGLNQLTPVISNT